jgi:hypothetical protein
MYVRVLVLPGHDGEVVRDHPLRWAEPQHVAALECCGVWWR